ncbi:unnamed protein product, partial [Prorocentrum cordatum]
MGGSESMTINPTADGPEPMPQGPHMKEATDADDGLEKQLDIARQVSDVSTAATQSPAGVSPWAPPCEPVPFHQLESMDEAGNSEQLSEEEQDRRPPRPPSSWEKAFGIEMPLAGAEAVGRQGRAGERRGCAQDCSEPARICLGMPPLQSELGQW